MVWIKAQNFMEMISSLSPRFATSLGLVILSASLICYSIYLRAKILYGHNSQAFYKSPLFMKIFGWTLLGIAIWLGSKYALILSLVFIFAYFLVLGILSKVMNLYLKNKN